LLIHTNVCKNDIFPWIDGTSGPASASSLLSFRELTQDTSTLVRPLDQGSVQRKDFWQHTDTQKRQTSMSSGEIRTCNPKERAAAHPRLGTRGSWDRLQTIYSWIKTCHNKVKDLNRSECV